MSRIEIHRNAITNVKTDAIVNAANSRLVQGGGVCGAIFEAAGVDELTKECSKYKGCPTGNAVITSACKLTDNKYIVHTVGPDYRCMSNCDDKLYSCYKESLKLAKEYKCTSICFPLISSGIFACPSNKAWDIAIDACRDFINENLDYDITIVFVARSRETVEEGKEILAAKSI